jgi:hypothetical protein
MLLLLCVRISPACSRHSSMSSFSAMRAWKALKSLSSLFVPPGSADDAYGLMVRAVPLQSIGLCLRQQPAHSPPVLVEHQYQAEPRLYAILSIGLGFSLLDS